MYDCFNEAIGYLKSKLGTKERNSGMNTKNSPDSVYKYENIIPYSEEHKIHLLLTQYYYGIEVKKELYYIMIGLEVIK